MGLIEELGELAIATRMLRLSEQIRKDVTRIYNEHQLKFESKWFPVLYALSKKGPLGVIELADEIGYTHPSVIALVKEMQKQKLVNSVPCKKDGRKRLLSLTKKASKMVLEFEPLWQDFVSINQIIHNNGSSLLKAIEDTEAALKDEGYYDRYKKLEAKRNVKQK